MKNIFKFVIIFYSLLVGLIYFYETSESVTIVAPLNEVWEYASNSDKAKDWSVFFHHISPLPGIQDGQIGSKRRCFRFENKSRPFWDEEVVKVDAPYFRELRTYNITGFKNNALAGLEFKVYQKYQRIDKETSKLTFSTKLKNPFKVLSLIFSIKYIPEVSRIFKLNLLNMKEAIEAQYQKQEYQRTYPYEPQNILTDP